MIFPQEKLFLLLVMLVIVAFQAFAEPKQLMEFKLKPPKGTTPHGICFAEYQGKEVVVCCFWKDLNASVKHLQGYDLKGRRLQITQDELEKLMGNLLEEIRFRRRYRLETRNNPWTLTLLDKCIYPNGGYCSPIETRQKLTLANAIWKVPLSQYTDYKKSLNSTSLSSFDLSSSVTFPATSTNGLSPVFTSASHSLWQFHIWSISGLDGKELAYYCSSKCGGGDFSPCDAFLDSTLQHVVVQGFVGRNTSHGGLLFYTSPNNFAAGRSCFKYYSPEYLETHGGWDNFFLSPDFFCSSWTSGNMRTFTEKRQAVIYSFMRNRIIADVKLNHQGSNPCSTWEPPWCDITNDGKYLVIGFRREHFARGVFSAIFSSGLPNAQNWVRVYQLEP